MGKTGAGPLFPLALSFLIFGLGACFGWETVCQFLLSIGSVKLTDGRATRSIWPAILDPELCYTPWDTVPKVSNLPSSFTPDLLVFRGARHVEALDRALDRETVTPENSLVRWRLLFLGPDRRELLRMRLRRISIGYFHLYWPGKPNQYPVARSEAPCPGRPFFFLPAD